MTSKFCKRILKVSKTKEFWTVFLITLIGAFLRFFKLRELMVFLGDEGRDALVVKRLIIDYDLILVGPTTSVGKIHLPPLYYYFMAPWLAFFKLDPVGPTIAIALLGTLTIPLFYLVARKLLGKTAAIFGAILYTTASVVIAYTRFSWNPNPMPLVSLLMIYSLYKVRTKQNFKAAIGVWLLLGLALQLHYMVVLLLPFLILFTILSFWKMKSKPLHLKKLFLSNLIGFIGFLILLSPLFLFDMRHNWINLQGLKEFFAKGHHTNVDFLQVIKGLEGRSYQVIGDILGFSKGWFRNWFTRLIIIGFLILAWFNKKRRKEMIFLLAWLGIGTFGLALYKGDVYLHYLGFLFPLPFLVVGHELAYLWEQRLGKILALLILVVLVGNNLYHSPAWGKLGWNVDDVKGVAQVIAKECSQKQYNVVLIDPTKDYRAMNYRYFLEVLGCPPLGIEDYPQAKLLYILSQEPINDFNSLDLWEVRSLSGELELIKDWKFEGGPFMYKLAKKE